MKRALLDTDILSLFLRGNSKVGARLRTYLLEHGRVSFCVVTYYEIVSGLLHRDARRQLSSFLEMVAESEVVPLTERSAAVSAKLYADLRSRGDPIDDVDLLIAGAAMSNDLTLVTHNRRHFARVSGLVMEDWAAETDDVERPAG